MHEPVRRPGHEPVQLVVEVHGGPRDATVRLTGEIDMVTAGQVAEALQQLLDQGCRTVEVDLAGVEFLAAAGLAVLVEQHRRYRDAAARMLVARPSPACSRLFALTGLDTTLTLC